MIGFIRSKRRRLYLSAFVVVALIFAFSQSEPLFRASYSPVLYDRDGRLLGAQVASDGQWRLRGTGKLNENSKLPSSRLKIAGSGGTRV